MYLYLVSNIVFLGGCFFSKLPMLSSDSKGVVNKVSSLPKVIDKGGKFLITFQHYFVN